MKTIALTLAILLLIPAGFSARENSNPSNESVKIDCGCHGAEDGPAAMEKEGTPTVKKKTSKFFLVAFIVVAIAAAGLAYLYVTEKNKKPEPTPTPTPTEKGDYTSVTLRFTNTFKALNNKYHLYIAFNSESPAFFDITGEETSIPAPGAGCNEAPLLYDGSFEIVITEPIHVRRGSQNYKINLSYDVVYCWDLTVEPIAYTYDTSKADPGMPEIWGVDKLNFQAPPRESGCFPIYGGNNIEGYQCKSEAWLYFAKPGQAVQ